MTEPTGLPKTADTYAAQAYQQAVQLYKDLQEPGHLQKSAQAALRSIAGVASIATFPYVAATGAAAASFKPHLVKHVSTLAEGAVTGVWNKMPFNAKVGIVVTGVSLATYYDPTSVFKTLGFVIALKLGAELGLRNFAKEEVAAATKEAEKTLTPDLI